MTIDKTANLADQFSSFKDPQRRFVVEAMMLRAEHAYRKARQRAVQYGINLPADPDPPPFTELTERYNKLKEEWAPESATDAGGALAYSDLVAAIVWSEMASSSEGNCRIVSTERDLGHALELLASARR
jgi:hypothetical protein